MWKKTHYISIWNPAEKRQIFPRNNVLLSSETIISAMLQLIFCDKVADYACFEDFSMTYPTSKLSVFNRMFKII